MLPPVDALYVLGAALFSAGASWGGAKVALNGTRQRVKEMHAELSGHVASDNAIQVQTIDRLARLETKIDYLVAKE